jgi:hypothetical protein
VLLNAFTRALRDAFPPARVAGLKAIVATARFHGPEEAATRVLPAVGPLCVDAVHEVRPGGCRPGRPCLALLVKGVKWGRQALGCVPKRARCSSCMAIRPVY